MPKIFQLESRGNRIEPGSAWPQVCLLSTAGHSSREATSADQMGKAAVRHKEGASLPQITAFNFPNTHVCLLPGGLIGVHPGQGQEGECSGLLLRP